MGGSPHVILIQVVLPPGLDMASYEKDELAKVLMAHTEQTVGPHHHRVVQARVIFFLEGSELYFLEEAE